MARTYAQLHTTIWTDPDFVALPASAQRVYMLAISQANVTYAGVVPFTARRWATMAADTTSDEITAAVGVLVDRGYVVLDERTEELWVRSWARYNSVLRHPNMRKAMVAAYSDVLSPLIAAAFVEAMPPDVKPLLRTRRDEQALSKANPTRRASEGIRPGHITREVEVEVEVEGGMSADVTATLARLAADTASPSFQDEAPDVVADLVAVHSVAIVDAALDRLVDAGRRFHFASKLRAALEADLPLVSGRPSVFDGQLAAQRVLAEEGNRSTAEIAAIPVDPEATSKVRGMRAALYEPKCQQNPLGGS